MNSKRKIGMVLLLFTILLAGFTLALTLTFGFPRIEGFDSQTGIQDRATADTSHTVDMPLTTTTSCTNFCGPQAQCAKTRDQCTSDVDCPGCQPLLPDPDPPLGPEVRGQNNAGKLGFLAPQYSSLTTDMGTQAAFYYPASKIGAGSKTAQVATAQLGSGITAAGKEGQRLFNKKNEYLRRHGGKRWKFEPRYPDRESATGLFLDEDGPLAANAYL
jgi:hypothetical protein